MAVPKATRPLDRSAVVVVVAVAIFTLTPIVASFVDIGRDWMPVGDSAIIATRARDVFTPQSPLLGQPSTAGQRVGRQVHHPGPLEFWAIAVGQKVADRPTTALVVTGVLNAMAALSVLWWLRRLAGTRGLALAGVVLVALLWSVRGDILVDPLNPFAAALPLTGYLIALVAVASGRRWALLSVVVLGSYAAQAHLTVTGLVGAAGLATLAACAVRELVRRRHDRPAASASASASAPAAAGPTPWRAPVAMAALLLGLCWAGPLVEAILHGGGNVVALASTGAELDSQTIGTRGAIDKTVRALAVRPAWAQAGMDTRAMIPPATWTEQVTVMGLWLVGLAVSLACRRRAPAVGLTFIVASATLAAGTALMTRIPDNLFNVMAVGNYVWLWPTGALLWGATLAGALVVVSPLTPRGVQRVAPVVALGIAGGLALASVLDPNHRPITPRSDAAYVRALSPQLVRALDPEKPYLLGVWGAIDDDSVAFGVLHELLRRGFDVRVNGFPESFGEVRSRPAEASEGTLVIQRARTQPDPPHPAAILLAEHVPSAQALDARRQAEERVVDRIRRAGGPARIVRLPSSVPEGVPIEGLVRDQLLGLTQAGFLRPEVAEWPEIAALTRTSAQPVEYVTAHFVPAEALSPTSTGDGRR